MKLTKILCPIDFSPGAQQALRVATRLARDTNAELVVAHAWFIPASAYPIEAPFPPYVMQQVIDDAQRGLDAAVSEAVNAGATHATGALLAGLPWAQIVEHLEARAYDLCVIGTHGRTGLSRVMLGSVAEKVVRHAPCSVLVIRPDGSPEPFRHALVPTDFSDSAAHALDFAASFVQPAGSLTALHVLEMPVSFSRDAMMVEFARELDKRAAVELAAEIERIRRVERVSIDAQTRTGHPGAEILATLDEDPSIDLVVMGSHGRTGIKRMFMGSVAEKVVRHARCPVLIARKRA